MCVECVSVYALALEMMCMCESNFRMVRCGVRSICVECVGV